MANLDWRNVPILKEVNARDFKELMKKAEPVILQGCDFGPCVTRWNLDYLTEKLGDQRISVHKSSQRELFRLRKNFRFEKYTFKEFASKLAEPVDGALYFKSACRDPTIKRPTRIEEDYCEIEDDLKPPSFIPFGKDKDLYHSSMLHISSINAQSWTHFDIYDNVLCQVAGVERVLLFPPKDSCNLYIDRDMSTIARFDADCDIDYPYLQDTSPWLCWLEPGDSLFIPKFWWHNVRSVLSRELDPDFSPAEEAPPAAPTSGHSIAFNIFWRDQKLINDSLYDDDTSGNRHLKPYKVAESYVDRAMDELSNLPPSGEKVYSEMLYSYVKRLMDIPVFEN